jgi:hypothetical protein
MCPSKSGSSLFASVAGIPDFDTTKRQIEAGLVAGTITPICLQAHASIPRSYFYMGFATRTPAQGLAAGVQWYQDAINLSLVDEYVVLDAGDCPVADTIWDFPKRDKDLDVTSLGATEADGSPVPKTIYRLREGIERFFITDINNPAASAKAQSETPSSGTHGAILPRVTAHGLRGPKGSVRRRASRFSTMCRAVATSCSWTATPNSSSTKTHTRLRTTQRVLTAVDSRALWPSVQATS